MEPWCGCPHHARGIVYLGSDIPSRPALLHYGQWYSTSMMSSVPSVPCLFFSRVWHQICPYAYHSLSRSYRLRNSDVCDARHDASCYAIVSEKLNWQSARSRCESGGGHLATIANQAENDVIKSMATSKIYIKYRTMCVELSILVALKLCLICGIPVRNIYFVLFSLHNV